MVPAGRQTDAARDDLPRARDGGDRDDAALVREFRRAYDAGDLPRATRCWEELVVRHVDRVAGLVGAWRLREHPDVAIPPADRDDVVQEALRRFAMRMIDTFEGTSVGELRSALRRLVDFACRDHAREVMRREQREVPLDEPARDDADGERGRRDRSVARALERDLDDAEARREAADDVAAALELVSHDRRRRVIELQLAGASTEEICARLGVSRDVVYQDRNRALREIAARWKELGR